MTAPTQFPTTWRKSGYSGSGSNCVEVAFGSTVVGVRDSKHREAGHFVVEAMTFRSFVSHIKAS